MHIIHSNLASLTRLSSSFSGFLLWATRSWGRTSSLVRSNTLNSSSACSKGSDAKGSSESGISGQWSKTALSGILEELAGRWPVVFVVLRLLLLLLDDGPVTSSRQEAARERFLVEVVGILGGLGRFSRANAWSRSSSRTISSDPSAWRWGFVPFGVPRWTFVEGSG